MCKDVIVFGVAETYFHGLDELHLFSNATELVYAMIASSLSKAFKFVGNEGAYPFGINEVDCALIEEALKLTKTIFQTSLLGRGSPSILQPLSASIVVWTTLIYFGMSCPDRKSVV